MQVPDAPSSPDKDNAGVLILPPQLFLGATAVSLLLHLIMPFPLRGAVGIALGLSLGAAGVALMIPCWKLFTARGTPIRPDLPVAHLVEEGPYRYTRNPMYIALLLIYTGMALLFGIGWFYVFLPALTLYLRFVAIAREEAYLTRRFGDEYAAYCQRVDRWL